MRTMPFEEEIAITNSKRANFINEEIKELFGINLVTCPECGTINATVDDTLKQCDNRECSLVFRDNEAPDLFY